MSADFPHVNNGVRQGGIMSPLLFNFYVNDLSEQLQKLPVGCCCGDMVVNHLMYADDIVLLAPSGKGMQTIIDATYAYFLTRFYKIAIQGAPQMAVDKEAISLSRVYSYYSKCNLPLFYV